MLYNIVFWWAMIVACLFVVAAVGGRLLVKLMQLFGVILFGVCALILVAGVLML